MLLSEFVEKLEEIEDRKDLWNPKVYIRIGLQQVPVEKIEFFPETREEFEAIVIQ